MKTKDKTKVDKPLKHKGKLCSVDELIEELNIRGEIDIVMEEDSWFNNIMTDLDLKVKH